MKKALALVLLTAAAACSSSGDVHSSVGPVLPPHERVAVRVAVKVPHRQRVLGGLGSRWISPSTRSIAIAFAPDGPSGVAAELKADLTPSSPACSGATGATICRVTAFLAPGSYTASVDTYDKTGETGNVVSHGDRLPVRVSVGEANAVSLTIGGVPHHLALSAGSASVTVVHNDFTFSAAGSLLVTATDADGNTIVGAGTPFSGAVVSGSGWSIAAPSVAQPDELAVQPGANGSMATLKVSVGYDAATCALPGVACSATVSATSATAAYLFVADCETGCEHGSAADGVFVYAPPYTGDPVAHITSGVSSPSALAIDASGNLYVANCVSCWLGEGDTVTVYGPPFSNGSTPRASITNGVSRPTSLAVNAAGDAFVFDCGKGCALGTPDTIERFAAPVSSGDSPVTTITSPVYTSAIAVDSLGTLLLLGCAHDRCYQGDAGAGSAVSYPAPYTGAPVSITNGIGSNVPIVLGVDGNGHMFVGSECTSSPCSPFQVTAYAAPYTTSSTPFATISNGILGMTAIAADSTGNLFVVNGAAGGVAEYAPPSFSDASPTTLFASSKYPGERIVIDGQGDLVMTNDQTVVLATLPYGSLTTIASAVPYPVGIAFGP